VKRSQHASFKGAPLGDTPLDAPLGQETARQLAAGLGEAGWTTSDVDLWRDTGWSFTCVRGTEQLELGLAATLRDEWVAQIAPSFMPGWFGRVFRGKKPSASAQAMHALALDAHNALTAMGFSELRWSWDRPPAAEQPSQPAHPAS
jgi:hypothetical protein